MYPGTLIPDIGHVEQIRIQAGLLQNGLEQGFVRPRRTGGDDHTVEVVLFYKVHHVLLRVDGAGVERILHMHHKRQGPDILAYIGDVHISADVDSAAADENAHSDRFVRNVPDRNLFAGIEIFREFFFFHFARICDFCSRGGRRACFGYGFRNVLRTGRRAAGENAVHRSVRGSEFVAMHEAVPVGFDSGLFKHFDGFGVGLESGGKHDHVVDILGPRSVGQRAFQLQPAVIKHLHAACTAPDELDAVFVLSGLDIPVKILSVSAHIHIINVDILNRGQMLLCDLRFLYRVHAADGGTVVRFALIIAGPDALDERDALRRLSVAQPLHMAAARPEAERILSYSMDVTTSVYLW